ncbi:unnamed protein product, partial [Amoebophrya sp. A25]
TASRLHYFDVSAQLINKVVRYVSTSPTYEALLAPLGWFSAEAEKRALSLLLEQEKQHWSAWHAELYGLASGGLLAARSGLLPLRSDMPERGSPEFLPAAASRFRLLLRGLSMLLETANVVAQSASVNAVVAHVDWLLDRGLGVSFPLSNVMISPDSSPLPPTEMPGLLALYQFADELFPAILLQDMQDRETSKSIRSSSEDMQSSTSESIPQLLRAVRRHGLLLMKGVVARGAKEKSQDEKFQ